MKTRAYIAQAACRYWLTSKLPFVRIMYLSKTSTISSMKARWLSLMKTQAVLCLVAAGQKGCIKQ
ncbi:hypothetical protein MGSAQ_002914 [marine sediment metagenome]|uniref:Uncharacterized protein n=1 Tax=marine sediment metagenome TaxID=412755 RepID=A0A1B6NQL2_9ZZZZ